MSESTQISCAIEIESMEQRRTQRLGVGQSVGQRWRFTYSLHSTWLSSIKKPACGRLLGDWLGLFLVNRASLQNVHPDLASGCGTWRECHLPVGAIWAAWGGSMRKCGAQHTDFFGEFPVWCVGWGDFAGVRPQVSSAAAGCAFTGRALVAAVYARSTTRTPSPIS
jgi:hypothetical protein